MSKVYIDEVVKGYDEHGCIVIKYVYTTCYLNEKATFCRSKRDMINFIESNKHIEVRTKYKRYGFWFEGSVVRVVDGKYLRTDGNNIKADNLSELD